MNKNVKQVLTIIGGLTFIAAAVIGTIYFKMKADGVVKDTSVYITTDATYQQLLDSMKTDGEIFKEVRRFRNAAEVIGLKENIRPGHYRLKKGTSYLDVAKMFQRGLQTPVRVTFNNIRTLDQLAGRISQQIEPDSLSLIQVFSTDTIAAHYGFTKQTFIAMFIPNTYELYWNTSSIGFMDRMKKEYDRFWTEERLQKLDKIGLSKEEATTLASIVYEETKMSDEMPTVAGVYINRLRINMPLQADPTLKFAIGDFAIKRILNIHKEVQSPYNTYKNTGLPPGPICMPSITAIDAILNYQEHSYLYFCAKPDFSGYHNFAKTLAEHNRNAQEWYNALNRAGIR